MFIVTIKLRASHAYACINNKVSPTPFAISVKKSISNSHLYGVELVMSVYLYRIVKSYDTERYWIVPNIHRRY